SRHEPLAPGVDRRVEALEGTCAEEAQVPRPCEDDLVDGLELPVTDERDAHVARDVAPIRRDEDLIALEDGDSELAEGRLRKPAHLRPAVHDYAGHEDPPRTTAGTRDLDVDAERAHPSGRR